jgi:hypothetical protein
MSEKKDNFVWDAHVWEDDVWDALPGKMMLKRNSLSKHFHFFHILQKTFPFVVLSFISWLPKF